MCACVHVLLTVAVINHACVEVELRDSSGYKVWCVRYLCISFDYRYS